MLYGQYEASLVLASVLVAILSSYTALTVVERVSHAPRAAARWWIVGGAFAMATGIWAMHFVGMLAFQLPIPLGYDFGITLLSWMIPVPVAALALWQVRQPRPDVRHLAVSAVLLGGGINAMHYVGMSAMRMDPAIVWNWRLVAASVAIAIAAAGASLWIAFRLRSNATPHVWAFRAIAAVVMGAAIAGMHYTGMAAAQFPAGTICGAVTGSFSVSELASLVIVATFAILPVALLASVYDAKLEARAQGLALLERAAGERQALLEQESAARVEAERLSALKDQFLATLSHELRTPLNAVLGWAQLLRLKRDEATLQKAIDTIERNARLQAQLIEDLLDMSRIVAGKVRLELQMVDPAAVVEAAVESARPAAAAKRIELGAFIERDLGQVSGDPARLQQILWNLLSNAVKFTPEGGRVDVRLTRVEGEALVVVEDNGGGIEAAFLPHVFDRFRQADASTTRVHGGLGIGLAIVRQLVELHGGSVAAASEGLGRGSVFSLRLPLANVHGNAPCSADAAPAIATSLALAPVDFSGMRILVVDDEPDARQVVNQLLLACGAEVLLAGGAEEALRVLAEGRPDVLVSDIGMPGVDGFELIRRVRGMPDPELARVPAMVLSAFARTEDRARATRNGFDCYVAKPVEAKEFLAAMAGLAKGKVVPVAGWQGCSSTTKVLMR
ncbi:response regulator [Ramlibacter sp. G-1-2-2]|uniref:histidine kinase n=1 Tax=Ramlibacter agri TaxID=2728837 RepID=A0A848HBT4_9BURK|nr:MHYT domain-containing protein [Ramlibacter agri]NML45038.1 response regulator [Ramlibacter agri]